MVLAFVIAQAAAAAVIAQAPGPAPAIQPPDAQQGAQGVISYPASFFAGQQVANASEMLARVPGFSLDTGSSVRGFEGAAGNVLIDGQRPTSKTDNLDDILRRIPVGQVERIDIIRGGAPGIDMQGKTIIANVIRKSGATFHGLFAIANDHLWDERNMHGMRLELGGGDGVRTWEATARYGYGNDDGGSDGPQVRIAPDGAIVRRSRYRSESDGLQQTLTAAYSQPLAGGRVSLNGRAFWDSWKSEDTNSFFDPAIGRSNTTSPYDDFQTELGARFNRDLGAKNKLEVVGLRTDRDFHAFDLFTFRGDSSDFRIQRDESETILRSVLKRQQSKSVSLEFGGEGALNKLDSRSSFFENGAEVALPAANVQVEEERGEVFAKGTWRISPKWTLDASLRFEASRISSDGDVVLEKTLQFLKPRAALSWDPNSTTQVRLRVEREVGQLNFDDFVAGANFNNGQGVSAGNPDLDPEQAWVFEGELEKRFWKGAAATISFRHYELTDVIDRGPVFQPRLDPSGRAVLDLQGRPIIDIFDQPDNIGDGTKDELTFSLTLPSDHFGWKGGLLRGELNKRWSSVTDPTTNTSRRISQQRPLEWQVHFSQDLPKQGVSYGFDLYSGWSQVSYRFDYISEVKLHNAYLNLFAEKRLDPTLTLRVELRNVTERGIRIATKVYDGPRSTGPLLYTDDRDLVPGRTVYLRLRKTFGS